MTFHLEELRKIAFFIIAVHFKHLGYITADYKTPFLTWLSTVQ